LIICRTDNSFTLKCEEYLLLLVNYLQEVYKFFESYRVYVSTAHAVFIV